MDRWSSIGRRRREGDAAVTPEATRPSLAERIAPIRARLAERGPSPARPTGWEARLAQAKKRYGTRSG